MRSIETKLPEAVYQQALELAARENLPVEQIISLAVAQAMAAWNNDNYIAARKQSDREKFLEALTGMINAQSKDCRIAGCGD
jgi:hypothetical protein